MTEPKAPEGYQVDKRDIVRATVGALAVAAILFLVAVLPAEYGLDPTGVGAAMGLVQLGDAKSGSGGTSILETTLDPVRTYQDAPRSVEESITLAPGEGIEYKFRMDDGEVFLFRWNSTGDVFFDFHGEPEGAAPGVFTSYSIDTSTGQRGSLTAPFLGTHGWYWENVGESPITIEVSAHGFFEVGGFVDPTR